MKNPLFEIFELFIGGNVDSPHLRKLREIQDEKTKSWRWGFFLGVAMTSFFFFIIIWNVL